MSTPRRLPRAAPRVSALAGTVLVGAALLGLSGCVAYPADGYGYGYAAPAYVYAPPPSVYVGVGGGGYWGHGGGWGHGRRWR